MKLYYDKRLKDPTYYVQIGFRNNKGKSTTKNIKTIGKHSELLKITSGPVEYSKNIVKEMNMENSGDIKKLNFTIDFREPLENNNYLVSKSTIKNIGYFYLEKIYNDLNIPHFIENIKKNRNKITFNMNDVNRFITFSRILDPGSKLSIYDKIDTYFEKPIFSYQHILRFMDVLADNERSYIKYLFNQSEKIVKRDTSVCFYDCTNFYFEIEDDDDDYIDEYTGELLRGFRQHGISKQHQNTPLIEMGLFTDRNGIPITMKLFPGNTNEQTTVHELETEMIKSLKDKRIIYCADAGLGSSSIRLLNDMPNKKFIVTQSIKKLSNKLKEEVFLDSGFKWLSNDKEGSVKEFKELDFSKLKDENTNEYTKKDLLNIYNDKLYKIIQVETNQDLGLYEEKICNNGNIRKVKSKAKLVQRIIVTFSRKMMEYQRNVRNKQIEKARNYINNNFDEYKKTNQNDFRRFIKEVGSNNKKVLLLDDELIKEEEKYDGYYAIATNLLEDSAQDIISINKNRYQIEDNFRVLKSYLDSRPAYHRLPRRLISHFLICYTALLIYKILEYKLNDTEKEHFTIDNIIETLKSMGLSNQKDQYYSSEYTWSKTLNRLEEIFNIGLDKKYYNSTFMKKTLKNLKN